MGLQHLINKLYMLMITHVFWYRLLPGAAPAMAEAELLMQVAQHSVVIVAVKLDASLAEHRATRQAVADPAPAELASAAAVA